MDMTVRVCEVVVKQLPETLTGNEGKRFFRELGNQLNKIDRASIVLDCSKVRQMDKSAIYLLLCCLEEAMKRNGDVKLAGIPSGARAVLELTGAARLFESFETNAEAIISFQRVPVHSVSEIGVPGSSIMASESAV